MKKTIKIICVLLLISFVSISKVQSQHFAVYSEDSRLVDGVWDDWKTLWKYDVRGSYGEILLYATYNHPSQYVWKFTISNFTKPSKAEIKEHYKNNEWWVYSGTFEYYITDEYPDLRSLLLKKEFIDPSCHDVNKGQTPCVKKTISATIKIAPYKEHPRIYNLFFGNGLGYAFNLYRD